MYVRFDFIPLYNEKMLILFKKVIIYKICISSKIYVYIYAHSIYKIYNQILTGIKLIFVHNKLN